MWEYQNDVGVPFLRAHPRSLLADEPGLGKTRQLLLAAEGRTLVCAPAMVLEGDVWQDEIAKWRPDLDVTLVSYSSCMLRKRGPRGGSVPTALLKPELRGHWDTVICDESHYLKGRNSKWTEALLKLRCDRWHLATGTPIPNWSHELFTTLQILYPHEARPGGRFGSYWRWVKQWFQVGSHWSRYDIGEPLDASDAGWRRFNRENLGDRYLMRTWEQVMPDLPPMRMQQIDCPMSSAQLKAYRDLKRDYLAILESGAEVNAWSSAGLHTKLAKCATSLAVLDPTSPVGGKLPVLLEQLRARPAEQVFVVAHFRDTCALLETEIAQLGRTVARVDGTVTKTARKAALRAFKDGAVDVLVGSIGTTAESFSFENVNTVIRVERSWLPTKNEQVKRRIRRASNLAPKLCIDLVTPKCVDSRMLPVLAAKTDQAVKAMPAREFAALL